MKSETGSTDEMELKVSPLKGKKKWLVIAVALVAIAVLLYIALGTPSGGSTTGQLTVTRTDDSSLALRNVKPPGEYDTVITTGWSGVDVGEQLEAWYSVSGNYVWWLRYNGDTKTEQMIRPGVYAWQPKSVSRIEAKLEPNQVEQGHLITSLHALVTIAPAGS